MPTNIVEIPFSRRPYVIIALSALGLFLIGLFLIIDPSVDVADFSSQTVSTAGIIMVILSLITIVYIFRKLSSEQMAIRIADEGIFDQSSTNFGFIPWEELESLKKKRIRQRRYLLLFVKNPDLILQKRKLPANVEKLQQLFESPIFLTNHKLNCSFDELHGIVERRFNLVRKSRIK